VDHVKLSRVLSQAKKPDCQRLRKPIGEPWARCRQTAGRNRMLRPVAYFDGARIDRPSHRRPFHKLELFVRRKAYSTFEMTIFPQCRGSTMHEDGSGFGVPPKSRVWVYGPNRLALKACNDSAVPADFEFPSRLLELLQLVHFRMPCTVPYCLIGEVTYSVLWSRIGRAIRFLFRFVNGCISHPRFP
jgi:hypothetical protein